MSSRFEYVLWRARAHALRGEALPQARLTAADVLLIRENRRGETARQLADRFGVHYRTIENVRARKTWAHV